VLLAPPEASAQTLLVRRNVAGLDPNGREIRQLREAFRIIRQRSSVNFQDRRGWWLQANIHAASCAHANWWFLPWHRGYLYYFERILRQAVNDPTLTIPYWDWSDPATRRLPAPFWGANNPLNLSTRGIGPNDQAPAEFVDRTRIIEPILNTRSFSTFGGSASTAPTQRVAGGSLEGTPHNNMHNWIGGANGDMSFPVSAARDPIFWLHHANVDRLWAEWARRNPGRQPTDSRWLNQRFSFYNEAAQLVTIATSNVLTTQALGYRYDTQPAAAPLLLAAAPAAQRVEAAPPAAASTLGPQPVTVPLAPTPAMRSALTTPAAPAAAPGGESLQLAIEGIEPPANPQVLVRVFINLPNADAKTPFEDIHYAGNFSFFTGADQAHNHHRGPLTQLLDVTETIRRLREAGQLKEGEPLNVTLVTAPIDPKKEAGVRIPFKKVSLSVVR
jgi:hypothetical protein